MGTSVPYSDVDKFLLSVDCSKGCILDTNFLISLTEENHRFYDDSNFIYEKLIEYKVPIFSTVTVRTEFIDYQRRIIVTEARMDMLATSSKWKVSSSVREELRKHRGWIDNQARIDELPCLTDSKIKEMKKVFLPKTQSGQIGWIEFCKEYLYGKLLEAWNGVEEALSINYVDMRDGSSHKYFLKELKWENMYTLSEPTALGSNDAMILNVLESSIMPFVVSADYDLAYGVMKSESKKYVLAPDNLYRSHLKRVRF